MFTRTPTRWPFVLSDVPHMVARLQLRATQRVPSGRYDAHRVSFFSLCNLVPMQGYQMYTSKNRCRHLSCCCLTSRRRTNVGVGNICRSSCLAAEGDADTECLLLTALFIHVLIYVGLTYTIVSVGCSQDTARLCTTHNRFSDPNRQRNTSNTRTRGRILVYRFVNNEIQINVYF